MRRVFAPLLSLLADPQRLLEAMDERHLWCRCFVATVPLGCRSPKEVTKESHKWINMISGNECRNMFLVSCHCTFFFTLPISAHQSVLTKVEHPGGQIWSFFELLTSNGSQLGNSTRKAAEAHRTREKVDLKFPWVPLATGTHQWFLNGSEFLMTEGTGFWETTLRVSYFHFESIFLRNKQLGVDGGIAEHERSCRSYWNLLRE